MSAVQSPKECIFCGSRTTLTGEHLWADWLGPHLPAPLGAIGHITSDLVFNVANQRPLPTPKEGMLHRRGNYKNQKLKLVCERCNTGWMSRLQTQARPTLEPMLGDTWPDFTAWNRRGLAAWAAMFTMVFEFADPATRITSFTDRERLRLWQEPPPKWYIWLGLRQGPMWQTGANHIAWSRPTEIEATNRLPALKKEVQCTAWVVGPVFFLTASSSVVGFKVDELAFAAKHKLRVLWPSDQLPVERPPGVLDDIDAHNAFVGLTPSSYPKHLIRHAWEVNLR